MLFPLSTAQNPVGHLSRELQMLNQSEICSEPQEAAEDHPETSTQTTNNVMSVSVFQHFYLVIVHFQHPFVPESPSM